MHVLLFSHQIYAIKIVQTVLEQVPEHLGIVLLVLLIISLLVMEHVNLYCFATKDNILIELTILALHAQQLPE